MTEFRIDRSNMEKLVTEAFLESSLNKDQTEEAIIVQGIFEESFKFQKERLEDQRELIEQLIQQLPPEYAEGFSFLNLCTNQKREVWTEDYELCEQLLAMAIGLDLMAYCNPRRMWDTLHRGGIPDVVIK